MFTTVTKHEHEKTTRVYPCGCAEIETFYEGSMGPYGNQHSFKSCGDHQYQIPSSDQAIRVIASNLRFLAKRESLDGTPLTLWEALSATMDSSAFVEVFRSNVERINKKLQKEEEEKIKRIRLNETADKDLFEAEQLLKDYKDVVTKARNEGRSDYPSYDKFIASMKKINEILKDDE